MSTPDPVQQPQKEEHKPVVLMSSQTRNLIVATAAVVILLTVMAWSGSARTEAAKKKGLAADVAALAVAERVFPSLRPSEAVDRFPLTRPVGGRARLTSAASAPHEPAWGYVALFSGLSALGLAGLARGRAR